MAQNRESMADMATCPTCGQPLPHRAPELTEEELLRLGEVRGRMNRMLAEPDPLAGLPASAKRALTEMGMADAPEKIARALQYGLLTRQSKGIGNATYRKIEKWLEGQGLVRVCEGENFFYKGSKKHLT